MEFDAFPNAEAIQQEQDLQKAANIILAEFQKSFYVRNDHKYSGVEIATWLQKLAGVS